MEIKFEVTKEDYLRFNLYHAKHSPAMKKQFNFLRYALPIILCVPIYVIGTKLFNQPSLYWTIIALLLLVIWLMTYPKQYESLIKKETEKLIDEGDNSEIFGKHRLTIEDETITIYHPSSQETISKQAIKEVRIYEDLIIIYTSAIHAYIVPVRYLNQPLKDQFIQKIRKF